MRGVVSGGSISAPREPETEANESRQVSVYGNAPPPLRRLPHCLTDADPKQHRLVGNVGSVAPRKRPSFVTGNISLTSKSKSKLTLRIKGRPVSTLDTAPDWSEYRAALTGCKQTNKQTSDVEKQQRRFFKISRTSPTPKTRALQSSSPSPEPLLPRAPPPL